MNVNEKFHYFTVLTLYYDKFAGILPKTMQKICICGGAFLQNIPSENRRFDAGRFRGGRGYGSGSGSVIWERRKREKAWLKAIVRRKIRLRLRHPPDN